MNTTYNTPNVQESRTRYNALLTQALANINRRKPEEVTTTATDATTTATQQPEEVTTQEQPTPVATPEATPATAPQATDEETTATDDATLLRDVIEQYGNIGADYLDTLDYTQATKQEPRTVMFGRAKVTEKRYTIDATDLAGNPQTYGLERHYNRNGKRAMFTAYKDGRAIELRWYGENNNTYHAELRCGECGDLVVRYKVEGGKVIRAERIKYGYPIEMERATFDDTNRPETPRDLPAPAPTKTTSKTTTKEAPATTKQEQPTSKTTPAPEEKVQEVTTSKPAKEEQPTTEIPQPETTTATEVTTAKEEPAPYWLLLDNELKAQQEEQEQALATPEATQQEEPMHAPQMLKKIIEEQKRRAAEGTNTLPLKTAVGMTTEVLTPKRAKELLGDNFNDLKTYVLVDGTHVVRFDRPELSNTLYIDDESKEYKEYQRGNISAVELWRNDAIRLNDPARYLDKVKRLPKFLEVIRYENNVLDFSMYGGRYGDRRATPDEVEIYKAAAAAASEAFTKRLDSYLRRYGKKIYVYSYWANR